MATAHPHVPHSSGPRRATGGAPSPSGLHRPAAGLLALALTATTAVAALAPADPRTATSPALVDVVVTSASDSVATVRAAVQAAGGTVRAALPLAGGVHATLPAGAALHPSYTVAANAPLTLASARVVGGAQEATGVRPALGVGAAAGQGAGVTVAVLDTGVADSPDLAGRLTHHDVTGTWRPGQPRDPYGHGTFVAGAAAGSGAASGGRYAGAAPGAHVLDVRVAEADGSTDLATVLSGLETARELGADVVNLSLSSGSPLPYQVDPLTVALDRLWAQGTVVVVPTGNDGPDRGSVTSPGSDPTLLTVGSLDDKGTADRRDDTVPSFSGRGPAPQAVGKPDLVAPGQSLVSLRAPGSVVDTQHPDAAVGDTYFRGSGTSFSTAVVAGAAAVLLQQRPDLTPDQVKALVTGTAYRARGLKDGRDAGAGGLALIEAAGAPRPSVRSTAPAPLPAGEDEVWRALVEALLADDRTGAAAAWDRLSPAGHRWAGHRWASLSPQGHRWATEAWTGHRWAGADGTAEQWQQRFWAADLWVGHRWASAGALGQRWAEVSWSGHRWAGHRWAEQEFAGHRWAGHRWAGHRWAGHRWAGHRWAGHRWAAASWGEDPVRVTR